MPYRRSYRRNNFRRRRGGRRRIPARPRPMSSADMAWTLAKRAWKNTRYLKGIINSEKKSVDLTFNNTPDGTTGISNFLNDVPVGDTVNHRDGMQVRVKSISIKGVIQMDSEVTQTYVRMLVVQWVGLPKAITPVPTDVLTTLDVNAHYNRSNAGNYKVLYDKVIIVDSDTPLKVFRIFVPCNAISRWAVSDTSGDEGELGKNGFYFMAFSGPGLGATQYPTVNIISRVMFYDN